MAGTMAMDTISGAGTIVATAITGPIIDPLTIIRLAIGALIIGQLLCSYLDSGSVDVARPVLAFQDGGKCAIRVALAEPNKAKNRLVEPSATISKAPPARLIRTRSSLFRALSKMAPSLFVEGAAPELNQRTCSVSPEPFLRAVGMPQDRRRESERSRDSGKESPIPPG